MFEFDTDLFFLKDDGNAKMKNQVCDWRERDEWCSKWEMLDVSSSEVKKKIPEHKLGPIWKVNINCDQKWAIL